MKYGCSLVAKWWVSMILLEVFFDPGEKGANGKLGTRWAPTMYKWSYGTPINGLING